MSVKKIVELRLLPALGLALVLTACGTAGTNPAGATIAPPVAGSGGDTPQPGVLLLGQWRALSLAPAGEKEVIVPAPARFTAEFRPDGRLALLADCNRCTGGYSAAAGLLQTTPLACTRAYCASAPLDTQFTALVGSATSWTVSGDRLELASASGVARLQR